MLRLGLVEYIRHYKWPFCVFPTSAKNRMPEIAVCSATGFHRNYLSTLSIADASIVRGAIEHQVTARAIEELTNGGIGVFAGPEHASNSGGVASSTDLSGQRSQHETRGVIGGRDTYDAKRATTIVEGECTAGGVVIGFGTVAGRAISTLVFL